MLESENSAMSMKLSQQQWEVRQVYEKNPLIFPGKGFYFPFQVEHRLAEIEMQICGASSEELSDSQDEERNQESAI